MKSVQQKYDEAAARNVTNFFKKGGSAGEALSGKMPRFAFRDVNAAKHHLGVRKNDTRFDSEITKFISEVEKASKKRA